VEEETDRPRRIEIAIKVAVVTIAAIAAVADHAVRNPSSPIGSRRQKKTMTRRSSVRTERSPA
jgi:hypothetical protein